jgi:hypothetical protein
LLPILINLLSCARKERKKKKKEEEEEEEEEKLLIGFGCRPRGEEETVLLMHI